MTAIVTVRIKLDQAIELKKRGKDFNLSDFVRKKLDEEFETQETLEQEEKEILKNKKPKEKENTEKEKFFREARVKIKENPNFLMGQWERYKNLFEKITIEKFKEMIK